MIFLLQPVKNQIVLRCLHFDSTSSYKIEFGPMSQYRKALELQSSRNSRFIKGIQNFFWRNRKKFITSRRFNIFRNPFKGAVLTGTRMLGWIASPQQIGSRDP